MRDSQKTMLGVIVVLIISVALLSIINGFTKEVIIERRQQELNKTLKGAFPQADEFSEQEVSDGEFKAVYIAIMDGQETGYVLDVIAEGYGGEFTMLVGVYANGDINRIAIGPNNESEGIGKKIEQDDFTRQFTDHQGEILSATDGGSIDTISGATISSKAAIKAAQDAQKFVMQQVKE